MSARAQPAYLSEAAWPSDSQGQALGAGEAGELDLPPLRYLPGALLGRGGQASVRAGFDPRLERHVALKRAHRGDLRARELLLREARLTARLDHPAIADVIDVGLQGDDVVVVLHVRHGRNLAQARADSAVRPGEAPKALLRALLQVCQAVAHAHGRGIVHRDLSPANVALGPSGEVTVLDWGLAAELAEAERGGVIGGTPGYAAPELRSGAACGPATDVWSLGALLHLLLTGEPPQGPLSRPAGSDRRLWAVLGRALAAAPRDRYPDAAALAAELAAYLDGDAVQAYRENLWDRLVRRVRRHPTAAAAVAAGAVISSLAIGVGGVLAARSEARARAAESHADAARSARLVDAAERALAIDDVAAARSLAAEAGDAEGLRARGVLAAVARAAPLPLQAEAAPCGPDQGLDADPSRGLAICRSATGVQLRGRGAAQALPATTSAAAIVADGAVWLGATDSPSPRLYHYAPRGSDAWASHSEVLAGGTPLLRTSPSRRHAVVFNAEGVARLAPQRGAWLQPCAAGRAPRDAAVNDAGRLLVWCAGDELLTLDGDRVVARVQPPVLPVLRGVTRMDWIGADRIAVGTAVGRVGVIELATGQVISAQDTPVGLVRSLAAAQRDGEPLVLLTGVRGAIAYLPWAERLVAAAAELPSGAALQALRLPPRPGDPGLRLSGTAGSAAAPWWKIGPPPALFASTAGMHGLSALAVCDDPPRLAVGDGNGRVVWFDLRSGRAHPVDGPPQVIKALAWSAGGRYLAVGAAGPQGMSVHDSHSGQALRGPWIGDLNVRVHQLRWLGSDALIAFSYGGGPYAWRIDAAGATPLALDPLPRPDPRAMADVDAMAASASGVWMLYQGGLLARYAPTAGGGVQLQPLPALPGAQVLAARADGQRALAASAEELIDLDGRGAVLRRWPRPGASIDAIALAQDGRRALCRRDGSVSLEDADGSARWSLPAHSDRCAAVAFCDAERAVCSVGWDGRLRLIAATSEAR